MGLARIIYETRHDIGMLGWSDGVGESLGGVGFGDGG
jgi:hypothetical protein